MFYKEHNLNYFHAEYQDFATITEIETGIIKWQMVLEVLRVFFKLWICLKENCCCIEKSRIKKIKPLD